MKLLKEVEQLKRSPIKKTVDARLAEFQSFKNKDDDAWFSELCFCILTANSKARTAMNIQQELGKEGFLTYPLSKIRSCIKRNRHRFHNNKARFIVEARKHRKIKTILANKDSISAREWLVKNIKGLGFKESSHFLRNVGFVNLAILDRHILNLLDEHNIVRRPKALTRPIYFRIERIFNNLAIKARLSSAELDLYLWFMKAGEVLK